MALLPSSSLYFSLSSNSDIQIIPPHFTFIQTPFGFPFLAFFFIASSPSRLTSTLVSELITFKPSSVCSVHSHCFACWCCCYPTLGNASISLFTFYGSSFMCSSLSKLTSWKQGCNVEIWGGWCVHCYQSLQWILINCFIGLALFECWKCVQLLLFYLSGIGILIYIKFYYQSTTRRIIPHL